MRSMLITTNEPAARRSTPRCAAPGRCLAEVEFAPLSATEASRWLDVRRSIGAHTLSELFALRDGVDAAAPEAVRPSASRELYFLKL